MPKVSDLVDVREVSLPQFPFLMYAERRGSRFAEPWRYLEPEPDPTVLHIARRVGLDGSILRRVTNCNRRADDWHIARFEVPENPLHTRGLRRHSATQRPGLGVVDGEDWKFCERCGTPEDFEKAYAEYLAGREAAAERRRAQDEIERQERMARLAAMEAELDNFLQAFVVPDAPLIEGHKKTNRYGRVYSAGDFEILIQVVNPN